MRWRLAELQHEADAELRRDRVQREVSTLALEEARERLAVAEARFGDLAIAAEAAGRFTLAAAPAADLPGRFVQKGQLIGYVAPERAEVARIAVSQDDFKLVRGQLDRLEFRLANRAGETFTSQSCVPCPKRRINCPARRWPLPTVDRSPSIRAMLKAAPRWNGCSCSTLRCPRNWQTCRSAPACTFVSRSIGSRSAGKWCAGSGRCCWRSSMPELAGIRERAGAIWREIRSDEYPVIAPYAERGLLKPWKWDRPLDLLLGKFLVAPPFAREPLLPRAEAIVDGFADVAGLGEEQFHIRCGGMRLRLLREGMRPELVDECFALIREATGRLLGMRHYPVQLMGGLVMVDGGIAEMATGEGKTITALLPAITAALAGWQAHVLTVNDYLAARDLAKLEPVYRMFGLTTGLVIEGQEPPERAAAYRADIVYGTNKQIAFDYLRDQAALSGGRGASRRLVAQLCGRGGQRLTMRGLHFAIIDEADSILIDEARTPLILSQQTAASDDGLYLAALELSSHLEEGAHFAVKPAERQIELSERGKVVVQQLSEGLPQRMWRIRQAREQLAVQALSATRLFLRDRDYVVAEGKVQIVDEGTGRTMPDRSWEGGLHQLIEVKEAVELSGGRNTIARITYQKFFRRYRRISGMSGTVREVADELWADFGLRVRPVPTNRPRQREHRGHVMWPDQALKWEAVALAVETVRREEGNRPVLIGTRSVADSDAVAAALARRGIAYRLINALVEAEEAEIVEQAGQIGAVTVATNMAGRGTDIELSRETHAAGGLHVILTAFHETARIDRQLYGRAGRQGDPGSSEAITALDDELYQHFGGVALGIVSRSAKEWPIENAMAEMLRKWAQRSAERKHAATRRQVELAEERLQQQMAFAGQS